MKKLVIVLVTLFLLTSCTNPQGATQFLKSQGYTEIRIEGYDFMNANRGDISSTHFKAKNANGVSVEGSVSENLGLFGWGARWSIKIN